MKIWGKKTQQEVQERELTIEDLITLERYEEAAEKLKARVKTAPKDLYSHLKLAEVYVALKEPIKAIDEFTYVGDSYAADGFYDKAIALVSKAAKMAPGDDTLPRRVAKYHRMKILEQRRLLAIEGLRTNRSMSGAVGNSQLQVELLWNKIAKSHLVEQLSAEQLKKLFTVMELVNTKTGEVLAERDSLLPMMYLVVDGVVEAGADVGGRFMNIRSFSTGDLIGDSALLEQKPWPAQFRVGQSGTLFRLTREGLAEVMVGNEDPRGFLSVLRQQANDRDVAASLRKLG